MEIEFIKKRIKEQEDEIEDIHMRYIHGMIDYDRRDEILPSAKSQLQYFNEKLKEHEKEQDRGKPKEN